MLSDNDLRNKLFEFAFELLISHGGDGDVVIVGHDYKDRADLFEKWAALNQPNFLTREDNEDRKYVIFYNQQETIFISNTAKGFAGCCDIIKTDRI